MKPRSAAPLAAITPPENLAAAASPSETPSISPSAIGGAARMTVKNPGNRVVAVSCPRSEKKDARAIATVLELPSCMPIPHDFFGPYTQASSKGTRRMPVRSEAIDLARVPFDAARHPYQPC